MALSLIALAREAEALSYHATGAKFLAPFAPEASAQHLKNLKTIHAQIGEMLNAEPFEAEHDLRSTLMQAEAFVAGFEDDESQDGVADLLAAIRHARAKAEARS